MTDKSTADWDNDLSGVVERREFSFRGKPYWVWCNPREWHPSWWSHMDETETRELWWDVKEGDVVLDIGADLGSYSLTALASGAAMVIAWSPPYKEAVPCEAFILRLSAWENGWEDKLTILSEGLWSSRGWLASMDGPRPPVCYPTRTEALAAIYGQPGHVATFPTRPLDEFVSKNRNLFDRRGVDWIKIDTEGSELEILKGAEGVLVEWKPNLLIENHPHVLPNAEKVAEDYIMSLGLNYKKVGTRPHHSISHSLYTTR